MEKVKIKFTDFWHSVNEERTKNNPLFKFLSKRYDLEISDNPDFLIYSCFGIDFYKYKCVRIFYTGENVRPNFKECDYAFSFDYPVNEKNYRLPLYKFYRGFDELKKQKNIDRNKMLERDFCSFICSNNKAKQRKIFFNRLQKYKKIASGGKVFNNLGYRVKDKIEFLNNYKFTISFENESYPGYTTEKLMQGFVACTVPIYWGNPLVAKDFNPKSFINCHDYNNFEEVIEKIIELDNNEELYLKYLMEPPFCNNEENEFVKEENIFKRFEEIFLNKNIKTVARKQSFMKLYTNPMYIKGKLKGIRNHFR